MDMFTGSFKGPPHPKKVARLNYKCLIFKSAEENENAFWRLLSRRRFITQASTRFHFTKKAELGKSKVCVRVCVCVTTS